MQISHPDGYLATPAIRKGDGILVFHAWWGLNDTIKAICDRLAGAGFTAFAPDFYHGKIADTIPEAEVSGKAVDADPDKTKAEVTRALRFLAERSGLLERGLNVTGFSLGASYALDLAAANPETILSVVVFYGTGPVSRLKNIGDVAKYKYLIVYAVVSMLVIRGKDEITRPSNGHSSLLLSGWLFQWCRKEFIFSKAV